MTPDEPAETEAKERWSARDWLHWLQPDERDWEYWDCSAIDENTVMLRAVFPGWPAAYGALDWLILAAGAKQVFADDFM